MNTTNELRNQRARIWEQAKDFLDSHRDKNGILSAEDTETYERMEQDIVNLGKEIDRQDRLDAFERELKAPTSEPLTSKPDGAKMEMKTGRASDEYKKNFWNALRSKYPLPSVTNALQVGTDSEGGYLVPDEFERTLIEALEEENIFRRIATVIHSNSGDRKIPVVASKGTAGWIDEEGLYPESDDSFGQLSLGAYKLGTMIKISEELLNDSAFDMEGYITREFARRIGTKEEEAFFKGDGTGKPLGLLADTGGADIGVTTTGASITADDVIDLYYSLRVPYRKKAKWIMNDSTVSALRKLKDQNGQYLWQPSLVAGTPNTILGCEVISSPFMPSIATGEKAIAFGDYSYYWIADRQGRTFKRLNELFATTGQVGFLGAQRVDGKLILPEAIKVLKLKGTAASGT